MWFTEENSTKIGVIPLWRCLQKTDLLATRV